MDRDAPSGAAEQRLTWVRLSPLSCVSRGLQEASKPTTARPRGEIDELHGHYDQDVRVKVHSERLGGRYSPEIMSPACFKKN